MFRNNLENIDLNLDAMAIEEQPLMEHATTDEENARVENTVSNEEFSRFSHEVDARFNQIEQGNQMVLNALNVLNNKIDNNQNNNGYDRIATPTPTPGNGGENAAINQAISDVNSSVHYDLDHDVIMKSRFAYTINQVPEPGEFTGKTSETELFCQLCEDNFKTYPNRYWPEDAKVNFVKSRLRGSARSWYLTKYKDNIYPATLHELLTGLKKAFTNVSSVKLAKIKLVNLKQTYGKIDDYIEEFRSYTRQFNWSDETLALFFYAGLHIKYQEEINKAEEFPTKLEDIITKVILFENSLNTKNKIREASHNKNNKKKNSNFNNTNSKNKNQNFNRYHNYSKFNNNNNNNSTTNKINENVSNVQKISSKN